MNPFGPVTGRCLLIGLIELELCSLSTHQTPKGFVIARRPGGMLMFIRPVIKCYDLELFIRVVRPTISFPLFCLKKKTNIRDFASKISLDATPTTLSFH